MMSRKYLLSVLSTLAATSMLLTACGEETLKCGGGTIEKAGKCTAETPQIPDPLECGTGTELDADGKKCIPSETPDGITCGPGTELDATGQNCVPSEAPPAIECGNGTVLENGACVAEVTCNDDQTAVGGFCLSPAEALAASPDAKNIDEPFELELPIENEHFIFTGTIDAPAKVDDELVQNTDSFTFEGEAGQWFEITLQSLGLPAPAFKIEVVIGEDDEPFTYERYSPFGAAAVARHIMLPIDATYKVTILPEQTITHGATFGADSWKYVGTVKQIETPGATNIELINNADVPEDMAGTFTVLPLNLFELETVAESHSVLMNFDKLGSNVRASVLVFSDLHTLLASYDDVRAGQVIEVLNDDEAAYVLVDWIQTYGPAQNYNVQARSQGTRTPLELGTRTSKEYTGFSAPENSVIQLSLKGSSIYPIKLSVVDADGEVLGERREVYATKSQGVFSADMINHAFYPAGGEFSIVADNDSDIEHLDQLIVEVIKPEVIAPLAINKRTDLKPVLRAKTFNFFMIESVEQFDILRFSQDNEQPFFENITAITVHDANSEVSFYDKYLISTQYAGMNMDHEQFYYAKTNGPLLIQLENFEPVDWTDMIFHIDAASPDHIPSLDTDGVKPGEAIELTHTDRIAKDGQHWLHLTVAEPIELTAALSAITTGDVDITGYTTDFSMILLSENDGNEKFDVRLSAGSYLFAISAHIAVPGGYKLTGTADPEGITITGSAQQTSFDNAGEITAIPARLHGSASRGLNGVHSYWKFTATHDTDIALDLTHMGGSFGMYAYVYNQDETTVHARTTEPMGVARHTEYRRSRLEFPVNAGETYFLKLGGEIIDNSSNFTYSVKITDLNP